MVAACPQHIAVTAPSTRSTSGTLTFLERGRRVHVDTGAPTNGCVSLARPELLRVLRRLRPGAQVSISA